MAITNSQQFKQLLAYGGRTRAAFGGIMDSATGRKGYLRGSFKRLTSIPKKITRAVKKVAKSPIGKLALMYAAGTYLGGTQAFGGTGKMTFAERLRDPKLLANLGNPFRTGIGSGEQIGMKFPGFGGSKESSSYLLQDDSFKKEALGDLSRVQGAEEELLDLRNLTGGAEQKAMNLKLPGNRDLFKTAAAIGIPAITAGVMTADQPVLEFDEDETAYGGEDLDVDIEAIRADPRKYLSPRFAAEGGIMRTRYAGGMDEKLIEIKKIYDEYVKNGGTLSFEQFAAAYAEENFAQGGRVAAQEGGLMDLGGMEKDYREEGGFVPIGKEEKADDVPARLSKNEFVFTADAVRAAGGGDIDAGAEVMYNVMKNLEAGGEVSEETQGLEGAREMFQTSQRLEEVI